MNQLLGNRYKLMKRIGQGGMADVYLAKDTVLEREVAIKILRGDLSSDPVALLRFQREANAASGLNHPNIVEVYDVGEDNGRYYIVMELMTGTTLKELIGRRGSLDKYEAFAIMEQLIKPLSKAHENQVIHRDIKPQNVLVLSDGTVKITDFGIALAEDALQLTKSDSVLGSVHYLAPECSRGEGASVQSDIYALGVVLYELLVGDVPFRGDAPVEVAIKHMRDPFPLVQKFNPSLPNSLANIIAKATHKNRIYRYSSAQEFLEDIQTSLDEDRADEPLWEPSPVEDEGTKIITKLETFEEEEIPPAPTPTNAPQQNKKRKNLIIAAVVTSVLLVALVISLLSNSGKNTPLDIPQAIGVNVEDVVTSLTGIGLKVNPHYDFEFSDEYEKDLVTETIPPLDDENIKVGSTIKLKVSQGLRLLVKDYTGMSVDEVKQALEGYNVTIRIEKEVKPDVKLDHVISQSGIVEGDRIEPFRRYELTLVVSGEKETIIPSDIIGKDIKTVKTQLEEEGISVKLSKLNVSDVPSSMIDDIKYDVVIRSTPGAGSYYVQTSGSVVELFYYDIADKPVIKEPEVPEENPEEKPGKPEKPDSEEPDTEEPGATTP